MIRKSLGGKKKKEKRKKKKKKPNNPTLTGHGVLSSKSTHSLGTYLLYLLHLDGERGFNDLVQIQISRAQAHNLIFLGVFLLGWLMQFAWIWEVVVPLIAQGVYDARHR